MVFVTGKYLSRASLLATVAWFFWNPTSWKFEWEPIVVFLASLGAFISFDRKDHQVATTESTVSIHPADWQLFKKLTGLLPSTGVIVFLKEHDFGGSFDIDDLEPIRQFLYEWDNAEHRFIDDELETMRRDLYDCVKIFSGLISKHTSPGYGGWQGVKDSSLEYDAQSEGRHKQEASEINEAANLAVTKHQELFLRARKKLGAVDGIQQPQRTVAVNVVGASRVAFLARRSWGTLNSYERTYRGY